MLAEGKPKSIKISIKIIMKISQWIFIQIIIIISALTPVPTPDSGDRTATSGDHRPMSMQGRLCGWRSPKLYAQQQFTKLERGAIMQHVRKLGRDPQSVQECPVLPIRIGN